MYDENSGKDWCNAILLPAINIIYYWLYIFLKDTLLSFDRCLVFIH